MIQTKESFIAVTGGFRRWIVMLSHLLHNHDVTAEQLGKSDSHANINPLYGS